MTLAETLMADIAARLYQGVPTIDRRAVREARLDREREHLSVWWPEGTTLRRCPKRVAFPPRGAE
jgi:hypothetical protein